MLWLRSLFLWDWLSVLIILNWLVFTLRHNRGAILLVVIVIDKEVVLLSIDNRLDHLSGIVSLPLEDVNNDIHNLWFETWEAHKDPINDGLSEVF